MMSKIHLTYLYRTIDRNDATYSASLELERLFNEETSHLLQEDVEYFAHWMTCLFLEDEKGAKKNKAQRFWLKSTEKRYFFNEYNTNYVAASSKKLRYNM